MSREIVDPLLRISGTEYRDVIPVPRADSARSAVFRRAAPCAVCLLALYSFVAGIQREPANYDSLTYHLARTTYWIQQGGVADYITPVKHQLYHPPFASYLMMVIRLLTGSDRLTFIVSWLSYVGCLYIAWKITRKLRGNGLVAVVFAATIPMAILQAGSTQNNLTTAFWLLAMVWFMLDEQPLYVGLSVGLAMLTKSTAYLFAAPFLLWFTWRMRRDPKRLIAAGMLAFALNTPHWLRNIETFGSPLPSAVDYGGIILNYSNSEISPRMLISGLARNLALHIPFPGDEITTALGLNIYDPGVSWGGRPYSGGILSYTDSTGGAPLHVTVLIVLLPFALITRKTRVMAVCLLSGGLLFCGLILWQQWNARLHLPLLLLWSPVVAAVLPRRVQHLTAVVLLAFAALVVFSNDERPVYRWFQPYTYPAYYAKYFQFAESMKESECHSIYMSTGSNDPEYILHRLMPHAAFTHDSTDKRACATFYSWDTSGVRQIRTQRFTPGG